MGSERRSTINLKKTDRRGSTNLNSVARGKPSKAVVREELEKMKREGKEIETGRRRDRKNEATQTYRILGIHI
jgi:NADPH-dependent glutamate synthase beta subunit-like oxidoreductase